MVHVTIILKCIFSIATVDGGGKASESCGGELFNNQHVISSDDQMVFLLEMPIPTF